MNLNTLKRDLSGKCWKYVINAEALVPEVCVCVPGFYKQYCIQHLHFVIPYQFSKTRFLIFLWCNSAALVAKKSSDFLSMFHMTVFLKLTVRSCNKSHCIKYQNREPGRLSGPIFSIFPIIKALIK